MDLTLAEVRSLAAAIERLAVWLRRQAPPPLSLSSMSALDRLSGDGPLRVSDLAAREAMTQPGVTMLVSRLHDAGYAQKVADPSDGRATLVRITPAGRTLLTRRHAARARVLRDRLTELDDADRQLLLAALPAIERLVDPKQRDHPIHRDHYQRSDVPVTPAMDRNTDR